MYAPDTLQVKNMGLQVVITCRQKPLSLPPPATSNSLTRSDGIVSPKKMQSPPAQTEVFDDVEYLLWLLNIAQFRL